MTKIEDTIAALETKLKQAKALKQKQEAQKKAQQQKQTRAQDTRRKILVGSLFLTRASSSDTAQAELHALLDPFLTRPDDRALFNLDKKPESAQ
jgi:large subunit ribosomal protein L7/L12